MKERMELLAESIIEYAKDMEIYLMNLEIKVKGQSVYKLLEKNQNYIKRQKVEEGNYSVYYSTQMKTPNLSPFIQRQLELLSDSHGKVKLKGNELLLNLSRTLAFHQRLDDVLERIMDIAMEALPISDSCSLYIYDEEVDRLVPHVTRGFNWQHLQHIRFEPGESLTGLTFRSKRAQIFHHMDEVYEGMKSMKQENWKHFYASTPERDGERVKSKSAMCCPLIIHKECIGVVSINTFRSDGHFTNGDLNLLKAICNQAAFAVHRASLFTELEDQADKLMKLNQDIQLKNQMLEQTLHNHNHLMQVAIEQQGIEHIVSFIGKQLAGSVDLYDEFRQIITSYEKEKPLYDRSFPPFQEVLTPEQLHPFMVEEHQVTIVPIVTRLESKGFLVLQNKSMPLEHLDKMLIEEAQNIIAIELLKQEAVYETKQRIQSEFLEDIQGKVDVNVIVQQAKLLGLDEGNSYIFFGIHFDRTSNHEQVWTFKDTKNLHNQVEKFISNHFHSNIIFNRINGLRGLIGFPPQTSVESVESQINRFIDQLDNHLRTYFKGLSFSYALGRLASLNEIRKSFLDVWHCIEIFNKNQRPNQRMTYREVGVAKMMMNSTEDELYQFVVDQLKPLMDYGKQNKNELIETLESYLQNHQQVKSVAKQLHLHENTLNYRLRRISAILGVNVREANEIFQLQMAWNVMSLLGTKKEWLLME